MTSNKPENAPARIRTGNPTMGLAFEASAIPDYATEAHLSLPQTMFKTVTRTTNLITTIA